MPHVSCKRPHVLNSDFPTSDQSVPQWRTLLTVVVPVYNTNPSDNYSRKVMNKAKFRNSTVKFLLTVIFKNLEMMPISDNSRNTIN